jgi:hypothetical protein
MSSGQYDISNSNEFGKPNNGKTTWNPTANKAARIR